MTTTTRVARRVVFEMFGTARLAAGRDRFEVQANGDLTLGEAFEQLAALHPHLCGDPLTPSGQWAAAGYGVHVEGRGFVEDPGLPIPEPTNVLIVSMPAGG